MKTFSRLFMGFDSKQSSEELWPWLILWRQPPHVDRGPHQPHWEACQAQGHTASAPLSPAASRAPHVPALPTAPPPGSFPSTPHPLSSWFFFHCFHYAFSGAKCRTSALTTSHPKARRPCPGWYSPQNSPAQISFPNAAHTCAAQPSCLWQQHVALPLLKSVGRSWAPPPDLRPGRPHGSQQQTPVPYARTSQPLTHTQD